jgi:hypothetical protein
LAPDAPKAADDPGATMPDAKRTGTGTTAPGSRGETAAPRSTEGSSSSAGRREAPAPGVRETEGKPVAGRDDTATSAPPVNPRPEEGRPAGTGTVASGEPAPKPATPEPAPPSAREAPAAPSPIAVARAEIHQWMKAYQDAYAALDSERVREMNRKATLSKQQLSAASVQFSDVQIDVAPDGQSAHLKASVRYDYKWRRAGSPPVSESTINWPMRKGASGWVAF